MIRASGLGIVLSISKRSRTDSVLETPYIVSLQSLKSMAFQVSRGMPIEINRVGKLVLGLPKPLDRARNCRGRNSRIQKERMKYRPSLVGDLITQMPPGFSLDRILSANSPRPSLGSVRARRALR